jgi:hypothetical protein
VSAVQLAALLKVNFRCPPNCDVHRLDLLWPLHVERRHSFDKNKCPPFEALMIGATVLLTAIGFGSVPDRRGSARTETIRLARYR